jgi:deoxycytidylate deaminase
LIAWLDSCYNLAMQLDKWDERFLKLAREISTWSKDPSTKVGAVLVSPNKKRIFLGYNGFPEKMEDKPEWYEERAEKYSRIIHAEMNAQLNAEGTSLVGYTQYTWPFCSCDRCFVKMVQAGIARAVSPAMTPEIAARWEETCKRTRQYADEMKIVFDEVDFPTTYAAMDLASKGE